MEEGRGGVDGVGVVAWGVSLRNILLTDQRNERRTLIYERVEVDGVRLVGLRVG